ncbi:Uma2 family endonuclease [Micromonospora mirobrigensis]|uniref:Endonuclease, Uma2 family (Restriction endonuclease fold) n=1 Tax=Micromonospora mirobrigensis TaxID=262898 RepID=A0A1C4YAC9_9ACTN|nr:Uma2 family endonuclease [Micromonospora mirobrigensis]SCF17291.1 Endonuclease, Uma2 family (restriction endonuclease fold) [Micromonospora mirobrigensis]
MTAALHDEFPPPGEWTTDDLDRLPGDGRRRPELLDGNLLMSPSPTRLHQSIAGRLMAALEETCPADLDVTQGVEVRISRRRSFIPDLLVAELDASVRNPSQYRPNEVLLVVEIVSEGSRSIDRVLKPALYAEADIPYFWRIETESGIVVHAHKLDPVKQVYVEQARMTDGILLPEPWEMDIPLARITPRGR